MKLKVVARAAKPPTVNVKPHGANLTLPANVDVYVLDTATNSTPLAFTIGVVSRSINGAKLATNPLLQDYPIICAMYNI